MRLPADVRFEGEDVYVTRDEGTGDVILSARPMHDIWTEFIAYRDSFDIPEGDVDTYMSERPMNRPVSRRSVFEDEG